MQLRMPMIVLPLTGFHLAKASSLFVGRHQMRTYYVVEYLIQLLPMRIIVLIALVLASTMASPASDLDRLLENIRNDRSLMGIQLQITNQTHVIYHGDVGLKDGKNPITKDTIFRVASLSKSFASACLMLLVEQGKIRLNQPISQLLGFEVTNPVYPDIKITLEMVLSHQSSLKDFEPNYTNFLLDTYSAKTADELPSLEDVLQQGGKYYSPYFFSTHEPGQYFAYVNLNFVVAGTIIERVSGVRYDIFVRENILKHISVGLKEVATFNVGMVQDAADLGVLYIGSNGKWVQDCDYYPSGVIPQRNLTGYKVGKNGGIFGPQGGLRASVSHLSNYMIMLSKGGVTKEGVRVLAESSVLQMLKPIYQYRGDTFGSMNDFHLYGLGLYTTSYWVNDNVIPHTTVRGHTGSAYGLISAHYFWKGFTFAYIVNGALHGYGYGTGTIYERERLLLQQAAYNFTLSYK